MQVPEKADCTKGPWISMASGLVISSESVPIIIMATKPGDEWRGLTDFYLWLPRL